MIEQNEWNNVGIEKALLRIMRNYSDIKMNFNSVKQIEQIKQNKGVKKKLLEIYNEMIRLQRSINDFVKNKLK